MTKQDQKQGSALREVIERVRVERDEVQAKAKKLDVFLRGDRLKTLPENEQKWLRRQRQIMADYVGVLNLRLQSMIGRSEVSDGIR